MAEAEGAEPVRVEIPNADWEEVRRRQERTRALIARMRAAQERLDKAVERVSAATSG